MSGRFGNQSYGRSGNRYDYPASRSSMIKKHRQPREKIDYVLDTAGWYRKRIPKDASCLFRVVAEQVFENQAHYPLVRRQCARFMKSNWAMFSKQISTNDTCEQYIRNLQSEETFATDVEMLAMSMYYERDFVVYHHDKKEPEEKTQKFTKKVTLCKYGDNHYDSVLRKEELTKAGIAQAIVYEIQYSMVFKLGLAVTILTDFMLNEPQISHGSKRWNTQKDGRNSEEGSLKKELRESFVKKGPPFPYKIAKSFRPHIYRNVDFDVWIENRKQMAKLDQEAGRTEQGALIPGALCWINREPKSSENWETEWGVVQQLKRDDLPGQPVNKYSVWVSSSGKAEDFCRDQLKYRSYEKGSLPTLQKTDPYAPNEAADSAPVYHRGRMEYHNRGYYGGRPNYARNQNQWGPAGRGFSHRPHYGNSNMQGAHQGNGNMQGAQVIPRFAPRAECGNHFRWTAPVAPSAVIPESYRMPSYGSAQIIQPGLQGFQNAPVFQNLPFSYMPGPNVISTVGHNQLDPQLVSGYPLVNNGPTDNAPTAATGQPVLTGPGQCFQNMVLPCMPLQNGNNNGNSNMDLQYTFVGYPMFSDGSGQVQPITTGHQAVQGVPYYVPRGNVCDAGPSLDPHSSPGYGTANEGAPGQFVFYVGASVYPQPPQWAPATEYSSYSVQ